MAGSGAVDQFGNAYVAGSTYSTDFPTVNPTQAANAGGSDAFVAKLNAAGSALLYSSYLGGSGDEDWSGNGASLGVDTAGQHLRVQIHDIDELPNRESVTGW